MLKRLGNLLQHTTAAARLFAKDKRGNTSIIFGLTSIPLAMIASMAVEFGNGVRIKSELQAAADAGVLAAATSLASGQDDTSKTEVANDTFFANISDNTLSGFSANPSTTINLASRQITMTVAVRNTRMVNTLLADHMDINVDATAVVSPGNPICMMSLNPTAKESLYMNGTADVVADGCSIHVNSSHDEALRQVGSGTGTAESFCVNGDYAGSNYTPTPEKSCRKEEDPLEDYFNADWLPMAPLTTADCTHQANNLFGNGNNGLSVVLLEPGIYCGDLDITSGKVAILQGNEEDAGGESLYVFVNGSIDIRGGGELRNYHVPSDNVTPDNDKSFPAETAIVFTGSSAGRLEVNGGADLVIKAKSTGTFAGIAVAQDPTSIPAQPHQIAGGGDVNVDGIVYFPTQALDITGNGVIGNNADQFAILADTIEINGTGQLEIRIGANYQAAGLPELPESSERVRLLD